MNKREMGTAGELMAVDYLKRNGYNIVKKNYRCRLGEIDIIARKDKTTVFIEVKRRSSSKMGMPHEAVEYRKQRQIIKVAFYYAQKYRQFDSSMRFDVVEILGGQINHMVNAFQVPSGYGFL